MREPCLTKRSANCPHSPTCSRPLPNLHRAASRRLPDLDPKQRLKRTILDPHHHDPRCEARAFRRRLPVSGCPLLRAGGTGQARREIRTSPGNRKLAELPQAPAQCIERDRLFWPMISSSTTSSSRRALARPIRSVGAACDRRNSLIFRKSRSLYNRASLCSPRVPGAEKDGLSSIGRPALKTCPACFRRSIKGPSEPPIISTIAAPRSVTNVDSQGAPWIRIIPGADWPAARRFDGAKATAEGLASARSLGARGKR